MLVQLSIRDIVLIDRLDLGFETGLSVLTGETGAGKSILLDAFALALGARGDGSLVRHGEAQGQVTAVFDVAPGHLARDLARGFGVDDDGDLILRRVQWADGRTRAFLNDQPVSVQALRAVGSALVEIHGQHDDRALMDAGAHRALLDAFGGHEQDVAAVAAASVALDRAKAALASEQAALEKARQEGDYLRHAAQELARLGAEPGEEESLALKRQDMMAAEKVVTEINGAHDVVAGEGSPAPSLSAALRRLVRRSDQAPALVDPAVKAIDAVLGALDEARLTLEAAQRAAAFDPRVLEKTEERLFALRAAARKYNVAPDGLAGLRDRFEAQLAALAQSEDKIKSLTAARDQADQTYVKAAQHLSRRRLAGARILESAVNAELPPLKLERARFLVHIDSDPAGRGQEGFDRVAFWVETNPGTRPGPLLKVASGGELSRFMLALKVSLADRGSAPTLVFDEIDTGVGGAVADAIGQRLARMAQQVQVIAVTHAPQVAARAWQHFLIAKEAVGGAKRVATKVAPLSDGTRREEIARMLAGASITDEARAAARRLLEGAG
jgi:DNA repair protein RecN (Recombination protein N)